MKYILLSVILILAFQASSISVRLKPETGNPPSARKLSAMTNDSIDQKLYIFGGISDRKLNDMWEFDLKTQRWTQIHAVSNFYPSPRSGSFLLRLKGKHMIILFGGDTSYGPILDLWAYDIQDQTVLYIQWEILEYSGTTPPRTYYKAVCAYSHEDKDYIAVYGGSNKKGYVMDLFLLDLDTFEWKKLPTIGNSPAVNLQKMEYYKGSLYIWGDQISENMPLYKYDLTNQEWLTILPLGKEVADTYDYGLCVYKDNLYAVIGTWTSETSLYKINLGSGDYEMMRPPYKHPTLLSMGFLIAAKTTIFIYMEA